MATERIRHPKSDTSAYPDDVDAAWWEAHDNAPEFRARVARADADMASGRYIENATTEALEAFGRLDYDEACRLLDNPDDLKRWFAAQTLGHNSLALPH